MKFIYPLDRITDYFIKKHPGYCVLAAFFLLFVIAPIADLAIDHEWFKRKAIEVKYCYHWDRDTLQPYMIYKKGRNVKGFEKAYWMLAYYYTPDSLFPHKHETVMSDFYQKDLIYKVEILRYSEDSLLSKIRYKCSASKEYLEWIEIVPTFTLHDTLPTGYEAENEGYMKDIKLKKSKS